MTDQPKRSRFAPDSIAAPLRHAVFRRIWLASLVSNLGILIQGVGAAWAMTQMTTSADKVALVQTALMLPIMLISMPAGAIADMHDRRIVAMVSLAIAFVGATALTVMFWLDLVTPNILLALCFVVGSGMALFGPAWQASVSEQVPAETLPAAVALNGISYNIARSFGPAVGGIVVATAGAVAAFAVNAVLYLPLMVVLFLWNRTHEPSRLPRERLNRAIVSGVRYIANSPSIRIVLIRTLVTGVIGGSISALMPLVARDLLHGGAQTYGVMLGAFGMGAVFGALNISEVRRRMSGEAAVRACTISLAGAIAAVALSNERRPDGDCPGAGRRGVDAGGGLVQYRRAALGAALGRRPLAGGVPGLDRRGHRDGKLGLGASHRHCRGRDRAAGVGRSDAAVAAARNLAAHAAGRRAQRAATEVLADPEVRLSLTGRSGPLVVEIEYRVAQDHNTLLLLLLLLFFFGGGGGGGGGGPRRLAPARSFASAWPSSFSFGVRPRRASRNSDRLVELAGLAPHQPRHPVHRPQLVEHRPAECAARNTFRTSRRAFMIEGVDRVHQAEHAGRDQIVELDALGQPRPMRSPFVLDQRPEDVSKPAGSARYWSSRSAFDCVPGFGHRLPGGWPTYEPQRGTR